MFKVYVPTEKRTKPYDPLEAGTFSLFGKGHGKGGGCLIIQIEKLFFIVIDIRNYCLYEQLPLEVETILF